MTKIEIHSIEEWENYFQSDKLIATYKHSTRCGVSSMAWSRLERGWDSSMPLLFVDLIKYRELSNHIAEVTGVRHESPQLIISSNRNVLDHTSHMAINGQWVSQVEKSALQH